MSESQRMEYKRELTDGLEKEVVAFLNAREGGVLLMGVDDNGDVVGIENGDQLQLIIKDRLKHNIQPSIMGLFEIELVEQQGLEIIRITLAGGPEKPYFLKKYGMTEKGCYLRVGTASEPMPQSHIDELYSRRIRNTIGRMESTRLGLTFAQLKIYYLERGLELNSAFMRNLELLTPEEKPNFAAYLLADDNGVSIQIAKYRGTGRRDLVENRDYGRCCLVKALKEVLSRMDIENTIFTRIGKAEREERPMIDERALREAVVNAIVHNDYSKGSSPKFEFFSDRLEITSSGGLPHGVTEEDFFGGYSSPRNKEIMRVFRDLELVEHLGSGVPRILEKYDRDTFELFPNFLRIVFPFDGGSEESKVRTPQVTAPVTAPVTTEVMRLLSVLEGEMDRVSLQNALGLKAKTNFLIMYMRPALDGEFIEMTIPDKPNSRLQKYRLTAKGHEVLKGRGEV